MVVNGTVVKPRSRTKVSLPLSRQKPNTTRSSRERAEGLGRQSMMTDLRLSARFRVWTDSNAAKANASRRGLGRTSHIELKYLWLQEVTQIRKGKEQVSGAQNLVLLMHSSGVFSVFLWRYSGGVFPPVVAFF